MDVEIISVEMIKPPSPTPRHLRNYNLCLLDHLIPASYAPILIYYSNHDAATARHFRVAEKLDLLKGSLSETLTLFFPLAGTIRDDLSIDCDDQGARFTTAKVRSCSLNDFLDSPDLKMTARFLPCGVRVTGTGLPLTNIQANELECGGIVLGVCVSHRVVDGAALSNFLKSWAGAAKLAPDFSAAHLFPADGSWLKDASMAMWGSLFKKGEFVTRRFVFGGSSIAALKDMAAGEGGASATRVEAVSGFIWKHAMAASAEILGYKKPSLLTHLVNLRKRAAPNFSQQSLGNLIWIASGMCQGEKQDSGLAGLVEEVRRSISRIDGDYVKKVQGEKGSNLMEKCLKEMEEVGGRNVHHLGFTSLCKLGFYDVDFGWGKPVWVSGTDSSGPYFMNLAVLMDTRCGDGMEAWVTMDEQVLENNQEFTTLASLNPSPLGHLLF